MLEATLDRVDCSYIPGETIHAEIRWNLTSPPREIHLELRWDTEGKGTSDHQVVAEETWTGKSSTGKQIWSLRLPRGPESAQGQLLNILWSIRCDADGIAPFAIPLVVSRARKPIQLGASKTEWK